MSALPGLGIFLFFLLDDLVVAQADLAVHIVGNDVIPVGKSGIEFLDVFFAGGEFFLVLFLFPFVFLFDPLPLGFDRRLIDGLIGRLLTLPLICSLLTRGSILGLSRFLIGLGGVFCFGRFLIRFGSFFRLGRGFSFRFRLGLGQRF